MFGYFPGRNYLSSMTSARVIVLFLYKEMCWYLYY